MRDGKRAKGEEKISLEIEEGGCTDGEESGEVRGMTTVEKANCGEEVERGR